MEKDIVKLESINDISLLNNETRYININIDTYEEELNNYLLNSDNNYMYSEFFNNIPGYTYVDYETFSKGEYLIEEIINDIREDLNTIEKCKYIYTSLGNILEYDINIDPLKNDNYRYNLFANINNLWGSLVTHKCNSLSTSKIYYYILNRLGINNTIECSNDNEYYNKINIDGEILIVNLYKDIPYIQSKFQTRYFDNYNNDLNMDRRINYIKKDYSEKIIDESLKSITDNTLESILSKTSNIMNISNISSSSLDIIYQCIFKKYYSYGDITINNLYLNDIYNNQEHFILFSDKQKHFSYNYKTDGFIEVSDEDIKRNLLNGKIGIYLDEEIPVITGRE